MSAMPLRIALLPLVVLLLAGCTSDPTWAPDDPDPGGYLDPTTEDRLMANFKRAYDGLDTQVYLDDVLDGAFRFVFTENSPYAPADGWDRDDETTTTRRMFAGDVGYDYVLDRPRSGVTEILYRTLIRLTDWEDVSPSDPDFPDTRRALHEVELVFLLSDGGSLTVSGQQIFYVRNVPESRAEARWRLCGQQDLTAEAKANEPASWGSLKAVFRLEPDLVPED